MLRKIQIQGYRLVRMQSILVLIVAACWMLKAPFAMVSTLLGGIAGILPTVFFAYHFFRKVVDKDNKKILGAFYRGEFLKLLASIVLLVFCVAVLKAELLPLLTGFIAAHMAYMIYLAKVRG